MSDSQFCKISTKTGYILSSNVLEIARLEAIVRAAGDIIVSSKINRHSCAEVRAKSKKAVA